MNRCYRGQQPSAHFNTGSLLKPFPPTWQELHGDRVGFRRHILRGVTRASRRPLGRRGGLGRSRRQGGRAGEARGRRIHQSCSTSASSASELSSRVLIHGHVDMTGRPLLYMRSSSTMITFAPAPHPPPPRGNFGSARPGPRRRPSVTCMLLHLSYRSHCPRRAPWRPQRPVGGGRSTGLPRSPTGDLVFGGSFERGYGCVVAVSFGWPVALRLERPPLAPAPHL